MTRVRLYSVVAALAAFFVVAVTAGGADTFQLRVVSQTTSTITLGWDAQPGYGYLFSAGGVLVSRTNDPSKTSVKFSKVTPASYDVDVIVKGANGHYPAITPPPPAAACADGVDNDGDGKVDLSDPGCSSATDTDETDAPPPPTGFPDASNTGVPAGTSLTAYTGPSTVTAANTVIVGKTIGCITVAAAGVIIRSSRITCGGGYAVYVDDRTSTQTLVTVEDSEISCSNAAGSAGVGEADFVVRRTEITGCENGFDINQNALVEDSYVHNLYNGGGSHLDGAQLAGGHWNGSSYPCCAQNVTFRHNTMYGMGDNDTSFGTSAIISNPSGDVNILVDNNLLAGGAYTLYCDYQAKATNYQVLNNHFSTRFRSTVGFYGMSTGCSDETQSGNVIHETGQPVTLG